MTTRVGNPPLLRTLFSNRESDGRLQHTLEQLAGAAFLVLPRTGAIAAINGRAAALTEFTRDELRHLSLAEVVVAPAAAEALEQIHHLEPGHSRTLNAVPLRTRSGRTALVDMRLSALPDRLNGDLQVLLLAQPAEDRLAQERDQSAQARAFDALDKLLLLLAEPAEAGLEQAVELIGTLVGADTAALYGVLPSQPGLRLHASSGGQRGFPTSLAPSEAQHLQAAFKWTASQRIDGFLQQSARAAGWGTLLAQPVGDPPAIIGAICVAYRPGSPPAAQAQRLLAVAAQHLHQLTTLIGRQAAYDRARELAIRLSAQLAAINAQIEEGVVLLNARGTIDEINGAAARMLGYRSEGVTGLDFEDVLISDGPSAGLIRGALEEPQATFSLECRLLRRSGEAFPAVLRGRPLPMGGCVVSIIDQSQLRADAVQQEHLDQLAYVGQATQSFAHEIRGPLNNIAIGVQYVAAKLPEEPEVQQALGKIKAECTRLSALMQDMLAWAKPVNPNLQPTDLGPVLRRLLGRFSLKIDQRNVRLNLAVDPACPQVLADTRLLEHVFVNLIDNALQAMPAGGHLSVSLAGANRRPSGFVVEARVSDDGPGISDEARRRIFDPYFTTKPDGTGLGLAICKRLVTIHKGAIGVESYPGTGTIFTVTLPALEGAHNLTEIS